MYKLRFCTSCNSYQIGCTSCNLYRISPSNKPNLYNTVVQVGFKKKFGQINNFLENISYLMNINIQINVRVLYKYNFALINSEFTENLEIFASNT